MRIGRLGLLRYGRFTDTVLALPAHNPDIHIVFGPNEAGKSTALAALEDFLFGIPHNSPLNFLHDYANMRIGAVLQMDTDTLEARRRKGNKDTLLTPDEVPLPGGDGALAPFLAGADRAFFERMFSLDHSRLRQGGREILEARDEVGQTLFSAGAGIAGLRQRLKALEEEADALWATRRASRRKYYQVEDRLKAAESALREHTVSAHQWQELKRAHETACEAYATREQALQRQEAERRKLSRIRRVYRQIGRKAELDTKIAALGEVTPLPADAREKLASAEREDARTAALISTLTEQLETARQERAALAYDAALLRRAADIEQLRDRRIQVRAGKADLPKRRAELDHAEADLRDLADELEWTSADSGQLLARIPARSEVTTVRTLLGRHGALLSSVDNNEATLAEAETRLAEITQQLAALGTPVDVSTLAALIKAAGEPGEMASRISRAEADRNAVDAALQRHLAALKPEVADENTLAAVPVPPRDTVQTHRDSRRDLEQRLQGCRDRIRSAERELGRHRKAHQRVARDEQAVAPETLAQLRQRRDTGWSLIRRRYVDGTDVPDEDLDGFGATADTLLATYEAAVRAADGAADQRFDKAEAAARLAEIARRIAEQQEQLATLRSEENALEQENQALATAWDAMWAQAPFPPLSPDAMLEWMGIRTEVLGLLERRAAAERELAALRQEASATRDRLLAELGRLGVEPAGLPDQPLRVVLQAAADIQNRHQRNAELRDQLTEQQRQASADIGRKRAALEQAQTAWSEWQTRWAEAVNGLGLAATAAPETIAAQVGAIDQMREIAVRVNELRHERIGKIERDIAAFEHDVKEIVGVIASDLAGTDADAAVIELERRLDDARQKQKLQHTKDKDIAGIEKKIKECDQARRAAGDIIDHLQALAGVDDSAALRTAIECSDALQHLQTERAETLKTLAEEGDGLSVAELHAECEGVDLDQITAREDALGLELTELRERLMGAREQRNEARRSFEAIGGNDAAARAAAERQAALAELQEIAEQYVRVRAAALLLRWAIDRYRQEKQAPLLKRAGELFAILSEGSFSSLRLAFDDQDHAHLAGLRPDGATVGVAGMSTGTADQLYLALRIASIEDYLGRAGPLPFLADDLFINFDDARAGAGFRVLGQLAQKTQVIFFTHHEHLLDLARAHLGAAVSTISLVPDRPPADAG